MNPTICSLQYTQENMTWKYEYENKSITIVSELNSLEGVLV